MGDSVASSPGQPHYSLVPKNSPSLSQFQLEEVQRYTLYIWSALAKYPPLGQSLWPVKMIGSVWDVAQLWGWCF